MESGYSVVRESLSRSFWQDLPRPSRALRERISPSYCAMTPGNPGGGWDSSTAASRSAIEPQLRSSMPSLYPLQSGAHIHRARWVAGLTAWTDSPARGSPDQLSLPHQRINRARSRRFALGVPSRLRRKKLPHQGLRSLVPLDCLQFDFLSPARRPFPERPANDFTIGCIHLETAILPSLASEPAPGRWVEAASNESPEAAKQGRLDDCNLRHIGSRPQPDRYGCTLALYGFGPWNRWACSKF